MRRRAKTNRARSRSKKKPSFISRIFYLPKSPAGIVRMGLLILLPSLIGGTAAASVGAFGESIRSKVVGVFKGNV